MRYYKIIITSPTGQVLQQWSSLGATGTFLPGALNIELDLWSQFYNAPKGASYVRVWGVPLQTLGAASNLNNANIAVYAGMSKGLPLANPAQAGLIIQGTILQAFGNWIGTDMTLDMYLMPPVGQPTSIALTADQYSGPLNLVLNWRKGTPLSIALITCLQTAFPQYTVNVSINPALVLSYDAPAYYQTLQQLADFVFQISKSIIGGSVYPGVSIAIIGSTVYAYDATAPIGTSITINFTDLIGQPTWIGFNMIQAKCVMRHDIAVGSQIVLPPSLATTTPQSNSQYRQSTIFAGAFSVREVRHTGNFRQPSADSWATIINAYAPIAG